jgi:hypothetical protein
MSTVYLDVFDCYVAVPNGYALHTSGTDNTHLYSRGQILDPFGSILVSAYDGPYPADRWRVLSSEIVGTLTVDELQLLDGREDQEPVIIIHNAEQRLALVGASRQHAGAIVASCQANPKE